MSNRYTKAVLTVIAACLVFLCLNAVVQPKLTVHGAADGTQFAADKDHFYFFNPATGKVYSYLVVGGHTQNILQFSGSGELKPVPTY